jgi:hypothetical protein
MVLPTGRRDLDKVAMILHIAFVFSERSVSDEDGIFHSGVRICQMSLFLIDLDAELLQVCGKSA